MTAERKNLDPSISTRSRPETQRSLVGFVVGDVRYAVDIACVREIVTPVPLTQLPYMPPTVAGVADHRSEVLPVVDLRRRFNLPPAVTRRTKWIVIDVGEQPIGLAVDDVVGVLRIAEKDFRPPPDLGGGEEDRGIAQVTTHDRALVFVLDTGRFDSIADSFVKQQGLEPEQAQRGRL